MTSMLDRMKEVAARESKLMRKLSGLEHYNNKNNHRVSKFSQTDYQKFWDAIPHETPEAIVNVRNALGFKFEKAMQMVREFEDAGIVVTKDGPIMFTTEQGKQRKRYVQTIRRVPGWQATLQSLSRTATTSAVGMLQN